MERMLVVIFDNEKNAYEGAAALRELERDGGIAVYAGAVVVKNADGTTSVKQVNDLDPIGTLVGTSVGGLIGLLGGPMGMAIGAATGLTLGAFADIADLRARLPSIMNEEGPVLVALDIDLEPPSQTLPPISAERAEILRQALLERSST